MTGILQPSVRIAQLIKERVSHGFDGRQSLGRRVFEKFGDKVDGVVVGLSKHLIDVRQGGVSTVVAGRITHFIEGMRLDLRELVLHVIGIHGAYLIPRRRSQYLDDFDQLINA